MRYFILPIVLFFNLLASDSTKISFSNNIFPIIQNKCLPCHSSEEENPSEYFMDDFKSLMKAGKNGKAIISGNSAKSNFIIKLHPNPPFGKQMPVLTKKKLTDSTILIIKKWIDQGAKNN